MPLKSGSKLQNRYLIEKVLGSGGMGTVYLAHHVALGDKAVAIKEMSLNRGTKEYEQAVQQFNREAALLASLEHPSLVSVTDYFEEGEHHYLVMAYVDGRTLQDIMDSASAPLDKLEVLAWIEAICDVLEYLHGHQPPIIYRDLKPSNIMLDNKKHIRLLDFGIARMVEPDKGTATVLKGVGTPGYSPPEQFTNASTDARSDVYALGATLYCLLTREVPPFSLDLMMGEAKLTNPADRNASIGPRLQAVILRMMSLAREQRFTGIREVREALRAVHDECAPQAGETVRPPHAVAVPHDVKLKVMRQPRPHAEVAAPPEPAPAPEPPPARPEPAPAEPSPPRPRRPVGLPRGLEPLDEAAPPGLPRGLQSQVEETTTILSIEPTPPFSWRDWLDKRSWLIGLLVTLLAGYCFLPQAFNDNVLGMLAFPNLLVYRLGGIYLQLTAPLVLALVMFLQQHPTRCALAVFWFAQTLLQGSVYMHGASFPLGTETSLHQDWLHLAKWMESAPADLAASMRRTGFYVSIASLLGMAYLLVAGMPSRK